MKRVFQQKPGDCFRACLASILNLDLAVVPETFSYGQNGKLLPVEARTALQTWLSDFNRQWFEVGFPTMPQATMRALLEYHGPSLVYILTGRTASGQTHCAVCRNGQVIHDPAGPPTIVGVCDDGYTRIGVLTVV